MPASPLRARLPNELIAQCLLHLAPEERTPPVLLKLRAQGRVLKDVVESDPFWKLFSAKAAAPAGQSLCEAFVERMGDRPPLGNEYLMRIYRQTAAEFNTSMERRECIRRLGEDPDLEAAGILMQMRLRNTGPIVRDDETIIRNSLAKVCRMVKESMTADEIDVVADFCKNLTHLPAKHWTQAIAHDLVSAFSRHPQKQTASTQVLVHIPPHFWHDEAIARKISGVAKAWAFFGPTFEQRPGFAQELFDQFINGHQLASSDMAPTLTSDQLVELWESLPNDLQQDKARLHQLITLPTREKGVSPDFARHITENGQLRQLIAAKPHILGDLLEYESSSRGRELRPSERQFWYRAETNDALIRFTIEELRAAGDTVSLDRLLTKISNGAVHQRLISDGVIPSPPPVPVSPLAEFENYILFSWML